MEFSHRLELFGPEIFAALNDKKVALEAEGRHLYNLSVGTPDFAPADHLKQALIDAAQDNENWKYSLQHLGQVAQAVLPVLRVGSGIHHGLADVLGGRKVRRADAQIINGTALCFQSYLAFVQCGEDLVAEQVQSFGKFHDTIPHKNTCFQKETF